MKTAVQISGISKSYGALKVLHDIDIRVAEGAFCSLLGPSGCGKTTLLNMIGGLDQPDAGEIVLGDDTVYSAPRRINLGTEKRNIGYVFQNYALWPHMSVLDNVGYSLRLRRKPRAERDRQSHDMLERLELGHLADRYPYQLSGGQQQRVAIARSLVYHPRLLLLDEPLSNLDAQLRERARSWLKSVHDSFKLTTILVTHDQVEALSLSNQVVLLDKGHVAQVGSPQEVYDTPANAYVAEFVSNANVIKGSISESDGDGNVVLRTEDGITIPAVATKLMQKGIEACVAIRPLHVRLIAGDGAQAEAGTLLPFQPDTVLYQGASFEITGRTSFGNIRLVSEKPPAPAGNSILLPRKNCLCVQS
ncbi:ABC transporter ATP-binding protein [Sinorhizobium meliloti]|uniref:ABC transporter related protein n=1 Tax=Rhizobium meliloti TaxID=382 RepID=A0A2J0YTX0_RHIML|nr:ABC transporter ATP-binding protein [Sinorhizobium meliloti]PJR09854.1 ABC transporter related protein [Sinorhizobium meliloti]